MLNPPTKGLQGVGVRKRALDFTGVGMPCREEGGLIYTDVPWRSA